MKITSIGPKGIELTKVSERFIAKPYKCPAGVWTQGFGTTKNPDTGRLIKPTDPAITIETAVRWLKDDYDKVYFPTSDRLVVDSLTQGEMDAVLDFVYNTGGFWLNKKDGKRYPYKLFILINQYKEGKLPAEDLRKYWLTCAITAGGQKLRGLEIRRVREVDLFFTGNFK